MSEENVEMLRRYYEAFTEGGSDEAFKFLDPEFELRGPREFPDLAEPHFGPEGAARYLAKVNEVIEDYRMAPEKFIDAGDNRVLVLSREGGRGRGSGAEVQTHLTAHLWTLRAGKIVRMQSYWERAEAFEAAGLSE
jgi:ketosteroid isomerase-like protein